jgi:hypothetical protein
MAWWAVVLVTLGGDLATGILTAWVTILVIRKGLGDGQPPDSSPRA